MDARKLDIAWLQAQQRAERLLAQWYMRWQGERSNYGTNRRPEIETGAEPAEKSELRNQGRGQRGELADTIQY